LALISLINVNIVLEDKMKKLLLFLIVGFLFSVSLSADSVKICTLSGRDSSSSSIAYCTYTCPDGSSYKGDISIMKACPNNLKLVCNNFSCKAYYY